MKIYGVRVYPTTTDVIWGVDAPIYLHGNITEDCSDFYYIFRPLSRLWKSHFFATDFGLSYNVDGTIDDPIPYLREDYGNGFFDADVKKQLVLIRGDLFSAWGRSRHLSQGAFFLVFSEPPTFDLLNQCYWSREVPLNSATWPQGMRAMLHLWDDIYWQFFSTKREDTDLLVRSHANDPKLKMFAVDFDREYPDPSNEELQPATPLEET